MSLALPDTTVRAVPRIARIPGAKQELRHRHARPPRQRPYRTVGQGHSGCPAGVGRRRFRSVLHSAVRRPQRLDRRLARRRRRLAGGGRVAGRRLPDPGRRPRRRPRWNRSPWWLSPWRRADGRASPAAELEAFTGATLPDLLGPQVRLLFVGINPGLLTVAVQAHFARRGQSLLPGSAPGRA